MSEIGKILHANGAENCDNLQSEFTVRDICDINIVLLFSFLIGCKWKIKLQFCRLYFCDNLNSTFVVRLATKLISISF